MIKTKKQMFVIISVFILVIVLGTITYAFFNYTRTGVANNIRVGRIYFNTTQDNTINLVNAFPTSSNNLNSTNSSTVTINITGDTDYSEGIEYKVSIVDVQNTVNDKEIPISFSVEANDLGTQSNDYYNDRGDTTNVYNLVESGQAYNDQLIMIGYIKPDANGVDGSIDITAYLDKDKIGISDTVSRIENGNLVYGETGGDWIAGRTILTTTEWNSLSGNSALSFKVKVEANEGIWVEESRFIVMKNFYLAGDTNWTNISNKITSVEFSTNGTVPNNAITSFDATDITSEGSVTLYTLDDGLGNNTYKAIIVASDVIYAPENSIGMFSSMSKLVEFNSENFLVDNVTNMRAFFGNDSALQDIQTLSYWNTENVINMQQMFTRCESLSNIDNLANWDTSNVQNIQHMFNRCTSLTNVDGLIKWNTSNVQYMDYMFFMCTSLTNVNGLINWDTSNVQDIQYMFNQCSCLTDITGLANWNTSNIQNMKYLFYNCTGLTNVNSLVNWDTANLDNVIGMFSSCTSLTDISGLKNWNTSSVIYMSSLFDNCTGLTNINSLKNWNTSSVISMSRMFNQCTSLANVDLSSWNMSNVTETGAMFQLSGIKTLIMPNNYTRIDNFMFNHNSSYTGESFTIPKTVTNVGGSHIFYNFGKDSTFTHFIVENGSTTLKTIDGILYSYDGTRLISIPRGKTFTNNTYTIPEGVTSLNIMSFSRTQKINKVILPNSYVISRWYDDTDSGDSDPVKGNSLATAIYIYTSVKEYEVKSDNPRYSSDSSCIYSKDGTELIAVPVHYTGVLNIKAGTTTIGQEAFWVQRKSSIDNITQINIPSSVTTIESNQLTVLNYLMSRNTNPVTITIDSGNTAYHIVNNQIVAI